MEKIALTLFCFLYTFVIAAQSINQFDASGKRDGIWKKNFKGTTILRFEGNFKNGKEIGLFKFYKNIKGKAVLSATRKFNEIDNITEVKFYTSKGKVISEGKMRAKMYVGTWKYYQKNGEDLLMIEHYNDYGVLNGEKLIYYENGQVAEKKFYVNGFLSGDATNYSLKGVVLKKLYYEKGELNGEAKFFSPKGELLVIGNYKDGQKNGIWKYYEGKKLTKTKKFNKEGEYKPQKKAPWKLKEPFS